MKRTFITILVAMFAATGANAYSLTIDVVTSTGGAVDDGDTITINATIDGMATDLGPLQGIDVTAGWDNSAFAVAGSDVGNGDFGSGNQVLFPGFSGQPITLCQNTGETCAFINQVTPFIGGTVANGLSTGTLVMDVLDVSGLGTSFDIAFGTPSPLYVLAATFGSIDTVAAGATITVNGAAGSTISVVPEPTTAAMLGLGLLGLGFAGRRR